MEEVNYKELYLESQKKIGDLEIKIGDLEIKVTELTTHLKKYTAPKRSKKYYETHKEEILQKNKTIERKPISNEKRKEYNKKAYEKKKALKNIST